MRERVMARHLGSGEERLATIDDETSTMVDEQGNDLNFRFWTYNQLNDPSPGFYVSMSVIVLIFFIGLLFIVSGGSK